MLRRDEEAHTHEQRRKKEHKEEKGDKKDKLNSTLVH